MPTPEEPKKDPPNYWPDRDPYGPPPEDDPGARDTDGEVHGPPGTWEQNPDEIDDDGEYRS